MFSHSYSRFEILCIQKHEHIARIGLQVQTHDALCTKTRRFLPSLPPCAPPREFPASSMDHRGFSGILLNGFAGQGARTPSGLLPVALFFYSVTRLFYPCFVCAVHSLVPKRLWMNGVFYIVSIYEWMAFTFVNEMRNYEIVSSY